MGSRLFFSDVDFDLEDLDLEPQQPSTVDTFTTIMTGDKRNKSSPPKTAALRDASIDAVAEIIKSGQGTLILWGHTQCRTHH
jgi:hypothetical protein